jgi:predicted amidophosphoribosyltransferase
VLTEIQYGTFANYSPRGNSDLSKRSRQICGRIKAGKTDQIERAIPYLDRAESQVLSPFLNPMVTLVPVPRSAPLAEGALWPAKVVADVLAANGYGGEILPLVERIEAVPKSSNSPASERPLIPEHMQSMQVNADLIVPDQITIIDDVLTMGRTMFACAELLHDAFPNAEIRAFAMIRTQGMIDNIEKIFDPSVGTITGYPSGKSFRDP